MILRHESSVWCAYLVVIVAENRAPPASVAHGDSASRFVRVAGFDRRVAMRCRGTLAATMSPFAGRRCSVVEARYAFTRNGARLHQPAAFQGLLL